ncbi:MAG: MalY/PatB family protein [Flavobacteriaceae bacterium]
MNYLNPLSDRSSNEFVKAQSRGYGHLYQDEQVYPFWIADMDFEVAEPITKALENKVSQGVYSYEYNNDLLFSSISNWYGKRHGLALNPNNFVQVNGVLSGIALSLDLFSKENEGVIIQTPVYHMFSYAVRINKRKVVENPLKRDDSGLFIMDFVDLEDKMKQPKNTMLLLCNPHNPVGRVWTKEELQRVAELAEKYKVQVVSDEVHADILYGNHKFESYLNVDENSISLIGSPAKTFGMHSIATGYIYTNNSRLYKLINHRAMSLFINHGNALTFYATLAAYNESEAWVDHLIEYLETIISRVNRFLKEKLPDVELIQPQGTYQLWMDFSNTGLSEDELSHWVYKEAKMGLAPGGQFGNGYEKWFRLNIATNLEVIMDYLNLLAQTKPVT